MSLRKAVFGLAAQLPPGAVTDLAVHQAPRAFFREIVRAMPGFVVRYRLEELVTARQLNQHVGDMFRANAGSTDPRAINLMVFRGREELDLIIRMHKQRHHIIAKYIHGPQEVAEAAQANAKLNMSPFLASFYRSN
jgi:NADH dehydrogenase (ubiquinone) 1 alpha subcomplex subunit 6